jgi:4-carboxymuconolactone decarboxylase
MRGEAVEDYKTTLRRLALRDDRYIESLLADDRVSATISKIEPRAHALVRLAALIAMNAAPPSYMSVVDAADEAGVTHEEVVGTLIAVLPVVGIARVVSAAPNLGLAIGYDVGEALETLEHEGEARS